MKVTIKGHVFASQEVWDLKPQFTFFDFEASKGWVKVMPHEITVDVPDDFDIRPGQVEALEREKERITGEFQARLTDINRKIMELLAIAHQPSEVVS